jgi:hypothetical protein
MYWRLERFCVEASVSTPTIHYSFAILSPQLKQCRYKNNNAVTSLRVPDRDKELGFGGNAAGTLTPSSRSSSLVSGQLLHYPTNSAVLEEPVEEKVSRPGVLGPTVIHWFRSIRPHIRTGSGVVGPTVTGSGVEDRTVTHWFRCPGSHNYTVVPVFWVP